jgi:hypothetical protein
VGKLATLLIASGLPFAVTQFVRDRGCRCETALFTAWGGRPTEVEMRWRGPSTLPELRRRHALVKKHLDIALPTETEESTDPAAAEARYRIAVGALREHTRDAARFPLVIQELTGYGFRRNVYACRSLGLAGCLATVLIMVVGCWSGAMSLGWKQQVVFLALDGVVAAWWWRVATSEWVRGAALAYARQLLLSLEAMELPDIRVSLGRQA